MAGQGFDQSMGREEFPFPFVDEFNPNAELPTDFLGDNLFDPVPGISPRQDLFPNEYDPYEDHERNPQNRDNNSQTIEREMDDNNEDVGNSANGHLCQNLKGFYNFDASFSGNDQPNPAKSTPWTYSPMLDKLFVSFNLPCPVKFSLSRSLPFGCVIRATPYFVKAEHAHLPVLRCLTHQSPKEQSNQGFIHTEHVIRCDAPGAIYQKDGAGRLSVTVPFQGHDPALGRERREYLNYYFTCFSSCVGGMNRRPIVILFTLEHGKKVLGQKSVEVRVCACPGRDRMKCERLRIRKMETKQGETNEQKTKSPERSRNCPPCADFRDLQPPEKRSRSAEDCHEATLVSVQFWVNGKDTAKIYQSVLDSIKREATRIPVATSTNISNQRSIKQEE